MQQLRGGRPVEVEHRRGPSGPTQSVTFAVRSASVGGRSGWPSGTSRTASTDQPSVRSSVIRTSPARTSDPPGAATTSTHSTSRRASGRATAASVKLSVPGKPSSSAAATAYSREKLALQAGARLAVDQRLQCGLGVRTRIRVTWSTSTSGSERVALIGRCSA